MTAPPARRRPITPNPRRFHAAGGALIPPVDKLAGAGSKSNPGTFTTIYDASHETSGIGHRGHDGIAGGLGGLLAEQGAQRRVVSPADPAAAVGRADLGAGPPGR